MLSAWKRCIMFKDAENDKVVLGTGCVNTFRHMIALFHCRFRGRPFGSRPLCSGLCRAAGATASVPRHAISIAVLTKGDEAKHWTSASLYIGHPKGPKTERSFREDWFRSLLLSFILTSLYPPKGAAQVRLRPNSRISPLVQYAITGYQPVSALPKQWPE